MTRAQAGADLLASAQAMHTDGVPLMQRVVPADMRLWDHYPARDVVNGPSASRYFYHCHSQGTRATAEHGHFHLFLGRCAMPRSARPLIAPPQPEPRADAVHIAALSIDRNGLPLGWFTVNRWVTDEWLYPAGDVIAALPRFDLTGAMGDPLVNRWLTALVRLSRDVIGTLLTARDAALVAGNCDGEDRALEITSNAAIDLAALLDN